MSNIIEFEKKISAAAKADVPLPSKEFKRKLSAQLLNQPVSTPRWQDRFTFRSIHPARAVMYVVLILTIVTIFVVGPKNIYAAIQNLLRYIPGIGFVEPNRELLEPVTVERDGVKLTVQEMYVNHEETYLVFYLENLPNDKLSDFVFENFPERLEEVIYSFERIYMLETENGETLQGHSLSGYTTRIWDGATWVGKVSFPALPPNVTEAQFHINYLPNYYPGLAPEDWVVPVSLGYVDESTDPSSVFQPSFIVVPTGENEESHIDTDADTDDYVEMRKDVSLILNAVSITEEQIALSISINWTRENWVWVEPVDFHCSDGPGEGLSESHFLSLFDANRTEIPLIIENSSEGSLSIKTKTLSFSGDFSGLELEYPLTLELRKVNITSHLYDEDVPAVQYKLESELIPGGCKRSSLENSIFGYAISSSSARSGSVAPDHGIKNDKFARMHNLHEFISFVVIETFLLSAPRLA